jgi:hypothetical protein
VWEGGEKLDASKTSLGYAKINGRSVMKTVMRNTWRWQPKGNTYRSPADPTSLVITIEEFMALTDGQAVHLSTIGSANLPLLARGRWRATDQVGMTLLRSPITSRRSNLPRRL